MKNHQRVKSAFLTIALLLATAFLPARPVSAAVAYTSVISGDWNVPATWGETVNYPQAGDNVVISDGTTVELKAGPVSVGSFTIISGGSFITNSYVLTVSGSFSNAGSLTTGSSDLHLLGNFTNTGTVNGGSSRLYLEGTADQSIDGFETTSNVFMTKTGGTATFTSGMSANALTINGVGGTLNLGSGLSHTFTGSCSLTNGALNGGSSILNISGTINGTLANFSAGTGTVNYALSGGTQNVATLTYYNLSTSGNLTKGTTGAITVNHDLTVGGGTTLELNYASTVSGSTSVSGTLNHKAVTGVYVYHGPVTVNSGGIFKNDASRDIYFRNGLTHNGSTLATGSGNMIFETNSQSIGGTSAITIQYLNVDTITLTNTGTLTVNQTLSGTGTLAQDTGAVLNVARNITITGLTASAAGNTVNYTYAGNQTVHPVAYYHLTLSGSGTKTLTGVTTIQGDYRLMGTVNATTAAGLFIDGNLTIDNGNTLTVAGYDFSVDGTTNVNGTLAFSSPDGTKTFGGLVTVPTGRYWTNSGNAPIHLRGGLTNNSNSFNAGSGTYYFETNNQIFTGTIIIPRISVTDIILTNNGSLTVSTSLAGTGSLIQGTDTTLVIGGTSTISNISANASGNTVNYSGGTQTVFQTSYYNLTLSGNLIKTINNLTTVNGTLNLSGTVNATTTTGLTVGNLIIGNGTRLTVTGHDFTVNGPTTVSGRLIFNNLAGTKTFIGLVTISANGYWSNLGNPDIHFQGGLTQNGSNFTPGIGRYYFETNNQEFNGTVSLDYATVEAGITLTNKGNITFGEDLACNGAWVQGDGSILNVGAMADFNTLTATATGNTVTYSYAYGPQTVEPVTYYNLTLTNSDKDLTGLTTVIGNLILNGSSSAPASATLTANLTIGGNLSLQNYATLDVSTSNYAIDLSGNWACTSGASTFIAQSGTVTFSGTAAKTVDPATGVCAFNNVTMNNSMGLTLNSSMNVIGVLNFTSGNITTGSYNLLINQSGSVTNASNASHVIGNVRKYYANVTGGDMPDFIFPLGDASNYLPVGLTSMHGTSASGYVTAFTTGGAEHPSVALIAGFQEDKDVNRWWRLSSNNITFPGPGDGYDLSLNFLSSEVDAGANTNNFVVKRYSSPTTYSTTLVSRTSTSISVTDVTGMGLSDFVVGEPEATIPTVTNVTSPDPNGSYNQGDSLTINVTFSEPVVVSNTPLLTLETGSVNRTASYTTGSGGTTLSFLYEVQPGDTSADLDYVSVNSLSAAGGFIRSLSDVEAILTLPAPGGAGSLAANKAIKIDTTSPVVSNVTSSTPNNTYKVGDSISITIQFGEVVYVSGTPLLTLETGDTDRSAAYASGNGSASLIFTYTVQSGDHSTDLDYVAPNSLTAIGGSIRDLAGNDAVLTFPSPGGIGSLGANKSIIIDAVGPIVINVTSPDQNGSYEAGQIITVTVEFNEAVVVTETPVITLETGATDRQALFTGGSATTILSFAYTVQPGDVSTDLNYAAIDSLSAATGTLKDTLGNTAVLTLPPLAGPNSLAWNKAIVVDGVAPVVLNVISPNADRTYKFGEVITITVNFSEAVDVSGAPTILLETGSVDRTADYSSGDGTASLSFTYTVQTGDISNDLEYVGTDSLSLAGGSLRDLAGNDAILTLPESGGAGSLGWDKAILVDGIRAAVTNVTSPDSDGVYHAGAVITITVTFDDVVTVTGAPTLILETGSIDREATYSGGSETNTLSFTYTVVTGDHATDLDYASTGSLVLNGGTILGSNDNDANLILPPPGSVGSLGANRNITIETVFNIFVPLIIRG